MSIREKIARLNGKRIAVGFKPSRAKEKGLQVWGVCHVKSKHPLKAYLRSFVGSYYILDPENIEYVGEIICEPYEINY